LYVAIRAHDPEPQRIRAHISDRDHAFQDDFVGVVLDTFNDERRAFEFFVNPYGVQMDLFQNDVGGNEDESWDAIWDSAGRVTEFGYEIEMAIPFSSLRFKPSEAQQVWGLDILRIYPRDLRHRIGLNRLERNRNCYVCKFAKLSGFEGIKPGRDLEITPTVTSHQTAMNADLNDGARGGEFETEAGVSAKWGVTPNVTVNAALNPDFSQVEADSAQLDVNRQFAVFYEEKRPFFLEGADFFQTPFTAVYTRTLADPNWGAKLSGKVGKDAFGAFVSRDTTTNVLIAGAENSAFETLADENLSTVARYRRDLGDNSTIGALVTDRRAGDYANSVAGVDGFFRFLKTETFSAQLLHSATRYPERIRLDYDQPEGTFSDEAVKLRYTHRTKNWFWRGDFENVGTEFRAESGFMPQVDYRKSGAAIERTVWGGEKSRYNRFFTGVSFDGYDSQRGEHLDHLFDSWFGLFGPRQSFIYLSANRRERFYNKHSFSGPSVGAYFEIQPSGALFLSLDSGHGMQVDFANTREGTRTFLAPRVRYNFGRHTQLEVNHTFERLDVDEGRLYTANLTQVRGVYQLNVRTFLRLLVQYTDIERDPSLYDFDVDRETRRLFPQFLFSYKLNPQTVLFVGYTENRIGSQSLDLTQTQHTFFAKIGYAWMM
jgi:hypothetical protein